MIAAIDAHYRKDHVKFVCVTFDDWTDTAPKAVHSLTLPEAEGYVPGGFYKRELPGILEILKKINLAMVECIVIDGYVYLDDAGKLGLGGHLFEKLGSEIPVIGVAKSVFHKNEKLAVQVFRGKSRKPLYITGVGIEPAAAATKIEAMAGQYRMPDILRELDRQTKS